MRTDLALAALASAAVPGMKPVTVAGISSGDDGRAAELQSALVEDATGRRWVVRAPLTPVAGARLQRNDELVRQLSRHVPFKVPAAAGYAPVGRDGSAAVYPHVEGSPLDLRRLPAGPGLASAVGRALAAVHNIPRAVFEEQDVPVFDASGARQRAIAEVDRAAETGRVPTGLLARWEEAFEAAPLWQFATTPVHGAFTGSSVVVAFTDEEDASTGRVVAVTDWDEAMVGDPAVDLAELWAQSSRQAWEAVLDSYTLARTHRPDPYLHARARLAAELANLRGLALAVAEGDEETARRSVETLRRMDRLTEADDSLVPLTARPSGARLDPPSAPVPSSAPTVADIDDEVGGPVADIDDEVGGPVDDTDRRLAWSEADPTMEVPAHERPEPEPEPEAVPGADTADEAEASAHEHQRGGPAEDRPSDAASAGASPAGELNAWAEAPDDDATAWIERPVSEDLDGGPSTLGVEETTDHVEDTTDGVEDASDVVEDASGDPHGDGPGQEDPATRAPVGASLPPSEDAPTAGEELSVDTEGREPVAPGEPGPTPRGGTASEDERGGTAVVDAHPDDGQIRQDVPVVTPAQPEDDSAAVGTTPATQESRRAGVADQDVEELEDEARLHELYGMPAPERDTGGR